MNEPQNHHKPLVIIIIMLSIVIAVLGVRITKDRLKPNQETMKQALSEYQRNPIK